MYKKTGQSHHYLPRKGSYSTVPHRNGRVDVLPPGARAPLYDIAVQIADAGERLEQLRAQRDEAKEKLHSLYRFDQLRDKVGSNGSERSRIERLQHEISRLENEMRVTRRRAGELKAIVAGGHNVTFESVFIRLSRAELPDDVFEALSIKARSIVARATRKKAETA